MRGNSRHQATYDAARVARQDAAVIARGEPPQSLSDAEVQRGVVPVTRSPEPIPVRAWVRYGLTPVEVDAFTSTWTSRAVELVWRTPGGDTHRAWVWANAVRRRPLSVDERLTGSRAPR